MHKNTVPGGETGLYGGIAQLGERLPCKQEASGSIPLISTTRESGHLTLSHLTAWKDRKYRVCWSHTRCEICRLKVTSGAMSPNGSGSNPVGGTKDPCFHFIFLLTNGGPERREVPGVLVPRRGRLYALLAQLVEQLICNQQVVGSSPTGSSMGRLIHLPRGYPPFIAGSGAQTLPATCRCGVMAAHRPSKAGAPVRPRSAAPVSSVGHAHVCAGGVATICNLCGRHSRVHTISRKGAGHCRLMRRAAVYNGP